VSTAIVLAGPERKRILRELLSLPEPWSLDTRDVYHRMLVLELMHTRSEYEDVLAETVEKRTFGDLIFQGVPLEQAREQAASAASECVRDYKREHSPGRLKRERRRTFREAVTACDGALAVTTGLVEACIVCGGPFRPSSFRSHWRRSDSAYCSSACRQAAYRKRRNGQSQQKPIAAIRAARERQEILRAAREAGLSQTDINECIRVGNLTEEEFEELLEYRPQHSATKMLRAVQAAKRRQAAGGPTKQPEPRRGTR